MERASRPAMTPRSPECRRNWPTAWKRCLRRQAAVAEFMLGHTITSPGDLIGIVDLLVPELQRRGRFRTEYSRHTLRENLAESDL